MYIPSAFRQDDRDAIHALVARYPLGELVTVGPDGLLATTVPLLVEADGDGDVLIGHLARANPQRTHDAAEALAIFRGPDAYVTPSWYASKAEHGKVVPTWNYIVARARGTLVVHDDASWVARTVTRLTDHHEAGHPSPWSVDDAPSAFIAQRLDAIVGVEIRVVSWEASWKLSQNRPHADIDGVVDGLRHGAHGQREVAELIEAHRPHHEPPP
jgi:transcriptional regulator